jgi:hypothetical protein
LAASVLNLIFNSEPSESIIVFSAIILSDGIDFVIIDMPILIKFARVKAVVGVSGDRFRSPEFCSHPAIILTEAGLAAMQRLGSPSESRSGSILHGSRFHR